MASSVSLRMASADGRSRLSLASATRAMPSTYTSVVSALASPKVLADSSSLGGYRGVPDPSKVYERLRHSGCFSVFTREHSLPSIASFPSPEALRCFLENLALAPISVKLCKWYGEGFAATGDPDLLARATMCFQRSAELKRSLDPHCSEERHLQRLADNRARLMILHAAALLNRKDYVGMSRCLQSLTDEQGLFAGKCSARLYLLSSILQEFVGLPTSIFQHTQMGLTALQDRGELLLELKLHWQQAFYYMLQKEVDKACLAFEKAIAAADQLQSPTFGHDTLEAAELLPYLHFGRGIARIAQGDFHEAGEAYTQGIFCMLPSQRDTMVHKMLYWAKGEVLLRQNRPDEALQLLNEALCLFIPTAIEAQNLVDGMIRLLMGDIHRARSDAAVLAGSDEQSIRELRTGANDHYHAALKALEGQQGWNSLNAWINLGYARNLLAMGVKDEALTRCLKAWHAVEYIDGEEALQAQVQFWLGEIYNSNNGGPNAQKCYATAHAKLGVIKAGHEELRAMLAARYTPPSVGAALSARTRHTAASSDRREGQRAFSLAFSGVAMPTSVTGKRAVRSFSMEAVGPELLDDSALAATASYSPRSGSRSTRVPQLAMARAAAAEQGKDSPHTASGPPKPPPRADADTLLPVSVDLAASSPLQAGALDPALSGSTDGRPLPPGAPLSAHA